MTTFNTQMVCRQTGCPAKEVMMEGELQGFHCVDHPDQSVLDEDAFRVYEDQSSYFLAKKLAEVYSINIAQFESSSELFKERKMNPKDPGGHFILVEL